jgi:hypothetical protein
MIEGWRGNDMSEVQEIYARTVRPLPMEDRLRLAAMILDEITAPPTAALDEVQRENALAKLLEHAGAVRSGNSRSANNEQIDADWARQYGS